MRSCSASGAWAAFLAVETGRVCQAETLARTVAYLLSCSPVSLAKGGGLVVGVGMGTLSGPSAGRVNSSSVVFALLAGVVSCDSCWEREDSAEWKDSALAEESCGVTASCCVVDSCTFSSVLAAPFMVAVGGVSTAASAMLNIYQTSDVARKGEEGKKRNDKCDGISMHPSSSASRPRTPKVPPDPETLITLIAYRIAGLHRAGQVEPQRVVASSAIDHFTVPTNTTHTTN